MKHERGSAVAWPPLRRVLAALAAAALATGAGACFGDDDRAAKPPGPLGAALSHLPASTGLVIVLPTGGRSRPLRALERLGKGDRGRRSLRARFDRAVRRVGLDPAALRSQLGYPLALGFGATQRPTAALRVHDPARLRLAGEARIRAGAAERLDAGDDVFAWRERGDGGTVRGFAAIADRELVLARSRADLEAALEAANDGDNIAYDERIVMELRRLGDGALVRSVADAQRLLERDPAQARELRRIRWVRALGLLTAVARVERGRVRLEFELRTDRVALTRRDLPLAPGGRSPRLHGRAPAAFAVRAPDILARFLERSLAVTDPDGFARYDSAIASLRSLFGVDLHRDLLRKLSSSSVALPSPVALSFVGDLRPDTASQVTASLRRAAPAIDFSLEDFLPGTTLVPRGNPATRWEVRRGRIVVAEYAVRNGALVGSVGLGRLPAARAGRRLAGVEGSLVAVGDLRRLGGVLGLVGDLPAQALDPLSGLGDVVLGVRAATSGLRGGGRVELAPR